MKTRAFVAIVAAVLVTGTALRTLWLRADPPTTTVGIVWHDEGPWVHNARNRALWGVWRTDNWNPVFVTPVFTALEYQAFQAFGVGTWQARTVPVASGLFAIVCLMVGLAATTNRSAAAVGGALLATNYVFVMWNRAALMESTMTALIVAAWAAYGLAERRRVWGLVAGSAAVLAYFTKASAAFFIAALVADLAMTLARRRIGVVRARFGDCRDDEWRGAIWTSAGLLAATAVVAACFVLPHWAEYRFYNVTMSIERKPSYALADLIGRTSWLPVSQDLFSHLWLVLAPAALAIIGIVVRWQEARPSQRLLVWWVLLGLVELIVHDAGNARRYVMFVPALIALMAMLMTTDRQWLPRGAANLGALARTVMLPLVMILVYVVAGSLIRMFVLDQVHAGHYRLVVRSAAALAILTAAALVWRWPGIVGRLSTWRPSPQLAVGVIVLAIGWDGLQYVEWASGRTMLAYQASVALGRLLPPGTLVQGKLANGLSLENRIRPLFVGNHFGNYDDRLERDDARYILTYVLPSVGYESQEHSGLIQQILDRYPHHSVVATFDVSEPPGDVPSVGLPGDRARAALIDKFGAAGRGQAAGGSDRAGAGIVVHARD